MPEWRLDFGFKRSLISAETTMTASDILRRDSFRPFRHERFSYVALRFPLSLGKWLFFITTCVCLAFSAAYELIEWWAALIGEESAETFLGT